LIQLVILSLLVKYHLGPVHPILLHPQSLDLLIPLMVVFVPALVLHDRYTALLTRLLHREQALRTHLQREAEQRTFLERALLESSERERQAVGHELHDGVCQQITAAMLHCKAMEQGVRGAAGAPPERPPALSKLHTIIAILDQSLGQAHDLAQGLSPGELPADGLLPALRDLARRTRETCAITCEVDLDACPVAKDPVGVNHLYRIAQEAVANAVKHGPARWIRVRLGAGSGALVLEVDNDGRAPLAGSGNGMGLRIMRYRCGLIGASLELSPRPEGGARLRCTLPLAAQARMAAPAPPRLPERPCPAGTAG
jgi:signal transduction histidine kinase